MFIPHLSTISRKSWHYRLTHWVHILFQEPIPTSACRYWAEFPLVLVVAVVVPGVVIAFAGAALFMTGYAGWEAFHHPLEALTDVGYIIGGCFAVILFAVACVTGEKWLKRRCPPLEITD